MICIIFFIEERRCRCLASDSSCWPNLSAWQSFNESVDGRLISAKPSAAVCNEPAYDVDACAVARIQWNDGIWRSNQPGALQNTNWENSSCSIMLNSTTCNQGSVPVFGVNAIFPEHVQKTVLFAVKNNLRLVIKSTGHDYLGRSTAAGSLLLWLHNMKNMTLIPRYSSCGHADIMNAARISAGVQWDEVYRWLSTLNLVAIGGAAGSVGVAGGYLQGGGHSPLSRWKGMAADQVLEYEVITADGRHQTASACQNSDLFWALNGGGGGTYAVVLSVVLKTFPSPTIAAATYDLVAPTEAYYKTLIEDCMRLISQVANAGWSGYFTMVHTKISGLFHVPNGNVREVQDTLSQFAARHPNISFDNTRFYSFPSFYDFFALMLRPSNPTGYNVLLGSRLIPEAVVHSSPERVADVFLQTKGESVNGSSLLGHIVAGGQVSNTSNTNNSINPAWRTALLHMVYAQGWLDITPDYIQEYLIKEVTRHTQILNQLLPDSTPSCYTNEADPNELNWQEAFYGSREMYNRLKAVKNQVDPDGLLVCKNCVGSDDWTEDLNCPKVLNPTTTTPHC